MNAHIFVVRLRMADRSIRFVQVEAWNAMQAEELAAQDRDVVFALVLEG